MFSVICQERRILQSWVLICRLLNIFCLKMFLLHFMIELSVPSLPISFLEMQEI